MKIEKVLSSSALILAGLWAGPFIAEAWASPEQKYLAAAWKLIDKENYAAAEKQLAQAWKIARGEPEVHRGLFWVYVTRYQLAPARKALKDALATARKRAAKHPAGKAKELWERYLADLYSLDVELTILENEKPLSGGLEKGREGRAFKAALARVEQAYRKAQGHGSFISSIDDPIVDKTLNYMLARLKEEEEEEQPEEEVSPKRGKASTAKSVEMEEPEESGDAGEQGEGAEEAPEEASEESPEGEGE